MRIGLVCEGRADFIVIEHLLKDQFGPEADDIEFVRLQPHSDATGRIGEGGWRHVFQWCIRNTVAQRASLFEPEALFSISEVRPLDVLIVHLDADICEALQDSDLDSIKPYKGMPISNPAERTAYVRSCLSSWLDLKTSDATKHKHVLAVPVESTEAWLIAAALDEDIETLRDIMARACAVIYSDLGLRLPVNIKRIKKKPDIYARYIGLGNVGAEVCAAKCPSFATLVQDVEKAIAA